MSSAYGSCDAILSARRSASAPESNGGGSMPADAELNPTVNAQQATRTAIIRFMARSPSGTCESAVTDMAQSVNAFEGSTRAHDKRPETANQIEQPSARLKDLRNT